MIRWVSAKKVADGKIVGFWSQRHNETEEEEKEFATLEQIYEFAVRNLEDIKAGRVTREEISQYGIKLGNAIMMIAISKEDYDKYTINHMDAGMMKEALDKLPIRDDN